MKKVLIVAFSVVGFSLLLLSPSFFLPAGQLQMTPESQQQQARNYLKQRAESYGLKLSQTQRQEIKNSCLTQIKEDLSQLKDSWQEKQKDYQKLGQTIEESLGFITDNLRYMGEDASVINLSTVRIRDLRARFSQEAEAYTKSLQRVVVLDRQCQSHPEAFAAGLYEAANRRQATERAAQDLLDFTSNKLTEAFIKIQTRLVEIEG